MEVNELRIGNYIDYNDHRSEKVSGIVGNMVHFNDDTSCGIGYCFGTPLTPEILAKAGFEKPNNPNDFLGGYLIYLPTRNRLRIREINDAFTFNAGCIVTQVDFVHQLQNLYFALCNTELTINL